MKGDGEINALFSGSKGAQTPLGASLRSVSPISDKLGLAPISHTLNTGDLVLRDQHQYLLQHCIERLGGGGVLDVIIMRWTLCAKCHRSVKIVDMTDERTDQSMRTTFFFADSSEACSDIVILGLVLSLVFAQKEMTTLTYLNTSNM